MTYETSKVSKELAKYADLRAQLEAMEIDPVAIVDTLEGETDLNEAVLELVNEIQEREANALALKSREQSIRDRRTRLEKGVETLRSVILQTMDTAGLKSIKGDIATLTMRETPGKLLITDESLIPSDYWEAQDPKLNRKSLVAALDDGSSIPGAEISNGGISLTIRSA